MTDRSALVAELVRLVAVPPVERPLAVRLADATRTLLRVDGVSITVAAASPNRVTLAATDPVSTRLEQLQDVLSEGPCWDADLTGAPQRADLADHGDSRWPEFGPAAREIAGGRTVYGLPMRPQSRVLGVLSVHLGEPGDLPRGLEAGLFVADAVGAALLLDPEGTDISGGAGPWSGRAQIHQATGMLVAQLRIPAVDALAVLRAHAFAENTTLDDIATRVLSATLVFGKDPS